MASYSDQRKFIEDVVNTSLLEDSIEWIGKNFSPEQVFTNDSLEEWAVNNGFVKVELF